jgi:hypothetical protein
MTVRDDWPGHRASLAVTVTGPGPWPPTVELTVLARPRVMGLPADGPGAGCQLQTGNDKSTVSDRILRADKAQGSEKTREDFQQ